MPTSKAAEDPFEPRVLDAGIREIPPRESEDGER